MNKGLLEVDQAGQSKTDHPNVLAWYWQYKEQLKIVVINYSEEPSQPWLKLPFSSESTQRVTLPEELLGRTQAYNLKHTKSQRLFLELKPWESRILDMTAGTPAV